MIESEHKLFCTHKVSRQPCKSKIAQFSWFRHHHTQLLHTELNVESSTGHVHADACILLIQLCFHLFQLVQRFWITCPKVLAARGALWLRAHLRRVSDDRSKMLRIFQPPESLTVDVHDVSLQVLSMFSCSWSNSVKYLYHDQLLQYLIQTIQFLGFSLGDDVVAIDCSHRVRLKAVRDLVTYLECYISCFFENSLHVFLEETRCSSRSAHRSFHLPRVSRFFFTTRRIHRNRLVLWQQCMSERNADIV